MIPEKSVITGALEDVFRYAAKLVRGDTLRLSEIENIAGITRYTEHWHSLITKFRRRMLKERGIALRAVPCIGYELLTEKDQLEYCSKNRQKRASRQITRGIDELAYLPSQGLSVHQQRVRAIAIENMKAERRIIRRCRMAEKSEINITEALPKRPMPPE